MTMQSLLPDLVTIFGLSVVASVVCHRLRLPSAIGLLLAGVLAGPQALQLVRNIHEIELLAEIGVVPVMLMAPLLASMAGLAKVSGSGLEALAALLLKVLPVAAFGYSAYRWIVPLVLERITRTRSSEAFLLGVFMLCVGIALLTQSLGLSLCLGAFLGGLILSESEYSHQEVAVKLPFRDVLMSLFFISIGMLLELSYLAGNLAPMLLLTAAVLQIKPLVVAAASLAVGLPLRQAVPSGMALGQVGEFSLVHQGRHQRRAAVARRCSRACRWWRC